MRLSKDFTLQELTVSNTAVKHGISNIPNQDQITNLILLCQFILQPIKEHFNKPVIMEGRSYNFTVMFFFKFIYKGEPS